MKLINMKLDLTNSNLKTLEMDKQNIIMELCTYNGHTVEPPTPDTSEKQTCTR